MSKFTVVFTGGGSGGHVVPAITLIETLKKRDDIRIKYVGGHFGIERELVSGLGIDYTPISTGKLRRYLDLKNLTDIFRILFGFFQSIAIFWSLDRKSTLVFSMGGFVAVPVVFAARLLRFNVFIHEQTSRVGLANRLCGYVAGRIFLSFEKSRPYFSSRKCLLSGYPLRESVLSPLASEIMVNGKDMRLLAKERPLLLATGGGNGSLVINNIIKKNYHWLSQRYLIVHQVGKNALPEYQEMQNDWYFPVAFLGVEIVELMKLAKVVLSRSGAGTVSELIALRKVSIFVPLKIAQKNEQYHNAIEAKEKIGSIVVAEDDVEKADWPSIFVSVEQVNAEEYRPRNLGKNPRDVILQDVYDQLGVHH